MMMMSPPPAAPEAINVDQIGETEEGGEIERPTPFQRRIEFHLARKPFNGFDREGGDKGGGFRIETLNSLSNSDPSSNSNHTFEAQKGKSVLAESNGVDPELLGFRITFRRIGAGLQNLGNTCFLNSVLQCLTYTEPLAAYLQSGKHQNSCRTAGFCALCAIQKHVSRALNSTGRILAPKDLVSNLRCISRSFRNARQEDAHEYMVNLLESMHKCCLPSGVPSESPSAYERSLVHKIFGGRLRSQVKCLQCSYCSNKFDPFLDLSLEIVKADSLYKALAHFTAKEQLDGGAKQYQCQQCKQKVRALKQLTIHKPPHVLAVHLKRFGSHIPGQKIDKKIAFDPTLDLKPFVTGSYDGDLKYTLYGVLVHAGWSTHSGHYYCFVRTTSGMWYSLDDNQVVQVNERRVLEQKAYMLFYVRDQKNSVPRKPIDVVQKENIINFKLGLKESVQNGQMGRKSNGPSSHSSAQGDASKEGLVKVEVYSDRNSLKANNSPPWDRDAKITTVSSQKDATGASLIVDEMKSASSEKAPDSILHPANDVIRSVNAVNGDQNGIKASVSGLCAANVLHFTAKEDRCDPCSTITSCNGHVGIKKAVDDTVEKPLNANIVLDTSNEVSKTVKTQKLDKKETLSMGAQGLLPRNTAESINGKNVEGGISANSCGHVVSTCEGSLDDSQRIKLLTSLKILSQKKTATKKPHLAAKKKLFKSHIAKMHLTTNIIFGSTLGLRKKKHKRSRAFNLLKKNFGQEHMVDVNCKEPDVGPSTSVNFKILSDSLSTHFSNKRRKGEKLGGRHVTDTSNMEEKIAEELRKRVVHNGTLLSTEKQQPEEHHSVTREPSWSKDKRKEVNRNSLNRVLEETTVAKWDEVPVTGITESGAAVQSISIGYVGDEWDEEYDRGKRKKVRMNKVCFGGPNLFQEIASHKAKRKGARLESSSGTKPFRI